MEKLAINGGYPVRAGKIYYGRQWIDEDASLPVNNPFTTGKMARLVTPAGLFCKRITYHSTGVLGDSWVDALSPGRKPICLLL